MIRIECRELISKYGNTVFRLILSYTKNKEDTEDLYQEVFVKAVKKDSFRSEEHAKAWLLRVSVNLSLNFLRRKKPLPLNEDIALPERSGECADLNITAAVAKLEPAARALIYLHYFEGYSLTEAAKILKLNPSTLRSIHMRAKAKLKALLEKEKNERI